MSLHLVPRAPRAASLHIISNDKYWIVPHNDHFYDIVFLPSGALPLKTEQSMVDEFRRRIRRGIRFEADGTGRLQDACA